MSTELDEKMKRDLEAAEAYIAEQEDASGIAEVVAAHFAGASVTTPEDQHGD